MFERKLTERAKAAINLAGQSAMEMGHNYVGTEHLLLGLAKEDGGVAGRVLADNGVTEEKIINKIDFFVGMDQPINNPNIGFTPRTKSVLERSYAEARQFGHDYIGTEHILISLLRESESLAVRILNDLGVDIRKLYNDIISLVSEDGADGAMENLSEPRGGKGAKASSGNIKTPTLDKYGRDLTKMAKDLKLDPVVG